MMQQEIVAHASFSFFLHISSEKKFVLSHAVNTVSLDREMLLRERKIIPCLMKEKERGKETCCLLFAFRSERKVETGMDGWKENFSFFLTTHRQTILIRSALRKTPLR